MRRPALKPSLPAAAYRPAWPLPPAEDLRRFAQACQTLAADERNTSRRALFRRMAGAWSAVAAQVERTDDLILKLQAMHRGSLN